jgi:four helix bundle protein
MMRDHTKLGAFALADALVLNVYRVTRRFPDDERFGLTSKLRRAAVSIASNIVEGAARNSLAEYLRFLDMGYGSAKEVEYQLSIAQRLGYAEPHVLDELANQASETAKVLNGLVRGLRNKT